MDLSLIFFFFCTCPFIVYPFFFKIIFRHVALNCKHLEMD